MAEYYAMVLIRREDDDEEFEVLSTTDPAPDIDAALAQIDVWTEHYYKNLAIASWVRVIDEGQEAENDEFILYSKDSLIDYMLFGKGLPLYNLNSYKLQSL